LFLLLGAQNTRPVSAEDLDATPASVLALLQWQARQIAQLQREVAELKARLDRDSTNSSAPPSSTHPHAKPAPARPKSKRKRGGQPGHPKHERALIPAADCQAVIPCVPTECRRCGRRLAGTDPVRGQVIMSVRGHEVLRR
jgi:hypothetical protein